MPRTNAGGWKGGGRPPGEGVIPGLSAAGMEMMRSARRKKSEERLALAKGVVISPLLSSLTMKQQRFLALLAIGAGVERALAETPVHQNSYNAWKKKAWWAPAMQEAIRMHVLNPEATLNPLVPKALATYDAKLEEHNLDAAKDVLDRIWGKPMVKVMTQTRTEVRVVFEKRSEKQGGDENNVTS